MKKTRTIEGITIIPGEGIKFTREEQRLLGELWDAERAYSPRIDAFLERAQ